MVTWLSTCLAQVNREESRLAAALVSLSLWPESSLNALSIARNNRSTRDTRSPLLSVSWKPTRKVATSCVCGCVGGGGGRC